MRNRLIVTVLSLVLLVSCNQYDNKFRSKIDHIAKKAYNGRDFNGSILVAHNDTIYYQGAFGWSNADKKIKNNVNTKFRIGSVTKTFTSTLVLKLYEEGLIDIDKPITTYIPDYPADKGNKITVRHLLTHTSGIMNFLQLPGIQELVKSKQTPKQLVEFFWNADLQFAPGTQYIYSNSGYLLLGYIIEVVSGKTYQQTLREYIFDPLGMKDSGYVGDQNYEKNTAHGYIVRKGTYHDIKDGGFDASVPYAAGGLYSTAPDLHKFFLGLKHNKIISAESKQLMNTSYFESTSDNKYGMGVGIIQLGKNQFIGHEGQTPGFRSLFHIVNDEYLVVLLDNNQRSGLSRISFKIINQITK